MSVPIPSEGVSPDFHGRAGLARSIRRTQRRELMRQVEHAIVRQSDAAIARKEMETFLDVATDALDKGMLFYDRARGRWGDSALGEYRIAVAMAEIDEAFAETKRRFRG